MKTADYRSWGGFLIEYDETLPCLICAQPVLEASMGGTRICPSCDCGRCRYCGVTLVALRESLDGGSSLQNLRSHVERCGKMTEENIHLKERIRQLEGRTQNDAGTHHS